MTSKLKNQWSISHNYLAGITFRKWLRLLAENHFRISPAYTHRAAFITLSSLLNSGTAMIEKLRFDKEIRAQEIVQPPLFILGHWRSGTTFLHNLLAQDDTRFQYASTYQVVNPYTFLTSEKFITRAFPKLLPPTRPMDNMALAFSSPQEDEFAPLLMTLYSVYLGMSFPDREDHYSRYLAFEGASRAEIEEWKSALKYFCQKVLLGDSRSLILKSPSHTARIRILLELFPDARFIHIHRNPYDVFQSQRHFFDTAGWYTYLQRPRLDDLDARIIARHEAMYDIFFRDRDLVSKDRIIDVRYEDLEANPTVQIKQIYDHLGLDNFDAFLPKLESYVSSLSGYKRNKFSKLTAIERDMVATGWARSFNEWGYSI